mmetsp:Transcript_121480/g.234309  ORF Transcript_121480/g.234309 Transcript_121480/m.234309 type:complete len:203 (-) Transcript_121480:714-1322(-)
MHSHSILVTFTAMVPPATEKAIGTNIPTANFERIRPSKFPRQASKISSLATPWPENSTKSHKPVQGLIIATERKEAAEITDIGASRSSAGANAGSCRRRKLPARTPRVAPMATDGVSVPPAAPAPIEPTVNTTFNKRSVENKPNDFWCSSAIKARARPFPSKLGNLREANASAMKTTGMTMRMLLSLFPSGLALRHFSLVKD